MWPKGSGNWVVAGASRLSEERGALEQVAAAAAEWFGRCLGEEAA